MSLKYKIPINLLQELEVIEEAIKNKKYYAKCLQTVEDDNKVYCIKDKIYDVIDLSDDLFYIVKCEYKTIQLWIYNECFQFYIDN